MDHTLYHTGQFAQRACVSIRTLRYYDKVGLLSPSHYSEAGYRLYSENDFSRLQQILALKFLGLSLDDIKRCLQIGPTGLLESLSLQKAMMREQRLRLDAVIAAIDETEKLLQADRQNWEAIVNVIQVMQMAQQDDWHKKYFTDEQLQAMQQLSENAYTAEDKQKIAEHGKNWTEADQQVANQRWAELFARAKRLFAEGQDPGSPESQELAKDWLGLVQAFTQGDPGVTSGLNRYYKAYHALPAEQRPFSMPLSQEEWAFAQEAVKLYSQH